jgi:hypothetical protein
MFFDKQSVNIEARIQPKIKADIMKVQETMRKTGTLFLFAN